MSPPRPRVPRFRAAFVSDRRDHAHGNRDGSRCARCTRADHGGNGVGRRGRRNRRRAAGVDVTLKNVETGLTRSVVTADDGSYNVPGLPPGIYDARASLAGFTPAVRSGIELAVGQQASLNLTLKVGATEMRHRDRRAGARRHEELVAFGPRRREDDRGAAAERPQLHRARAAPARRRRLQHARLRKPDEPGPADQHQRRQRPRQQLSARRREHERLRRGRRVDRRGHHARRRHDPGIPRRHERVLSRLRPGDGRRDQRGHEVGHEPAPRLRVRVLPQQRHGRAQLLRCSARRCRSSGTSSG